MARVTSKLQVTIPKAIADRYGIAPGTEIEWLPAGEAIRVLPPPTAGAELDRQRRLSLFDRAGERQRARQAGRRLPQPPRDRGWHRDELYVRGHAD